MVVILETGTPFLKPGKIRTTLGGKPFRRYWFGWFALAIWPGDLQEYGDAVRGGEWVKK